MPGHVSQLAAQLRLQVEAAQAASDDLPRLERRLHEATDKAQQWREAASKVESRMVADLQVLHLTA